MSQYFSPELHAILTAHTETFQPLGLLAVILFGSFVRGEEREDSDVDICLVFDEIDSEKKKEIWDLERKNKNLEFDRKIDRVIVSLDKFTNEWAPIYTAIKRTGKVFWGNMDLINDKMDIMNKINSAEEYIVKLNSPEVEFLYIPVKHTIQAYLAMIGKGFTSRFEELYKLTVEELGEEYARMFLYIYKLQENELHVTKEECVLGLTVAKEIIKLYDHHF